jgi:hypothetical protein
MKPLPGWSGKASAVLLLVAGWTFGMPAQSSKAGQSRKPTAHRKPPTYVGSEICGQCHNDIAETYSKTDMGRSVYAVNSASLDGISTAASVFDQRSNRHFEVFSKDGALFQSEYETAADGKEVFRDTRKIDWLMGAGANGIAGIVQRDDYLFEAPLSYYANIHGWALSPGYQFADYGFTRPLLPECIVCHSGRPQPVAEGNGRFREPPFRELAIGCENCHGPGSAHVENPTRSTIVNPARLARRLADDVCMPCHQTGDARVFHNGKQAGDFRPGTPLDDTLRIFLVPFTGQSPPQDDLLEHYLSMRLSKCYRASGGKISCITCHDPHVQPGLSEAPGYFHAKCMLCHTEKSCTVPLETRRSQNPPDNCIACHMPKRDVKVISHSVLTNHRIVARPQEPFPDEALHMTTTQLPDLVQLIATSGSQKAPDELTLLRAYAQVMLSHSEYRQSYRDLAKQLAASHPDNIYVLQGLADVALQKRNAQGLAAASRDLDLAIAHGSTRPADFEQLARMLIATGENARAADVLRQGIKVAPYYAELYRLLGKTYASLGKASEVCNLSLKALDIFPQDSGFRAFAAQCSGAKTVPANH